MMIPAQLILQSGQQFAGFLPSRQTETVYGELVFNTGMVGYVEALTDPSYRGQLLTFTYPLIGNYGVPPVSEWESTRIQAAGVIVSEAAFFYQHRKASSSFLEWCEAQSVPVLMGVDTRAVAKTLSHQGVTAACITTDAHKPHQFIDIDQMHLVQAVSIREPVDYGAGDKTVIAIDCGMKANSLRHLQKFPLRIRVVPFDYDFTHEHYDAVFISNGPGDPAKCVETIRILQKVLMGNKPIFGICLGAQMMALAIGAKTYKLPFGHRAQNHPCLDTQTKRCYLTSQNHGFSIDEKTLPKEWQVRFRHLNDGTVQGIAHQHKPFFSVQFHPEAAPGPTDTAFLFEQFYASIVGAKNA